MKTSAKSFKKLSKTRYLITIDGHEFTTYAYNEESAISNAAYRYAEQEDEEVALIRWKIKENILTCEVEEDA